MLKGTLKELHRFDDYLIHQMSGPISRVETTNPEWFDRFVFELFDPQKSLYLDAGLGAYPNAGIMDGFAIVAQGNTQRNVRLSRRLHNDREKTEIGPLSFEAIEPMERWSLNLGENEYGISFSLECQGLRLPVKTRDITSPRLGGGPDLVFSHYFQISQYTGSITIDGKVIPVKGWSGTRDRSWGERRLFGGTFGTYLWLHIPFSDHGTSIIYLESVDGKPVYCDGAAKYDNGEEVRIVGLRHSLELEPDTVRHTSGQIVLTHPDGSETVMKTRRLFQGPSIIGGGYAWRQGFDFGEVNIEGDSWDINAPDVMTMPVDVTDQIAEFDDGKERVKGIFEAGKLHIDWKYRPTL